MKNYEAEAEQNRKKFSVKVMYFNRYLFVRYVAALFFFTNVYWLILLLMSNSIFYYIPLALLIASLFSIAELIKVFSSHTNRIKKTKYHFMLLFWTNAVLIPTCFSPFFSRLYPFFVEDMSSRLLMLGILIIGLGLSAQTLHRLNQIKRNEDKHYSRIKQYEEVIEL